ncbi:hypothetical protein TetV_329 [Tetraselmis virus 1]|uniref:Uncharacterized protein n=1 Tax=Tetraselmis virus 1 TaxID=2060617 RepID=A0A2P0VND6_9VIRU|nr:hypothetical protein QJ968_gp329 [Tetraselmis virus 1]AUF82421.1 hypothetical protein TetV_329 [Tetraselmis virus 1]
MFHINVSLFNIVRAGAWAAAIYYKNCQLARDFIIMDSVMLSVELLFNNKLATLEHFNVPKEELTQYEECKESEDTECESSEDTECESKHIEDTFVIVKDYCPCDGSDYTEDYSMYKKRIIAKHDQDNIESMNSWFQGNIANALENISPSETLPNRF